jgi:hypothetical protein
MEMDKLDKLLSDAILHVDEAESKVKEWLIKRGERERFLNTIKIIKDQK